MSSTSKKKLKKTFAGIGIFILASSVFLAVTFFYAKLTGDFAIDKKILQQARKDGYIIRKTYPLETSSDAAERTWWDFPYYWMKIHIGSIEMPPPGSNFDEYFANQNFTYSPPNDLIDTSTITISAVGDIMYQGDANYETALDLYDDISDFIFNVDFATGNLESPVDFNRPAIGFPKFNFDKKKFDILSGRAKYKDGFDLFVTANNHMFDNYTTGVKTTLDILDSCGIIATGTARSQAEQDSFPIVNVKGVKIAFLAYSYGVNKREVPPEPYWGNLVYLNSMIEGKKDLSLIYKQVESAKERGADLIWVNLHWGAEWENYPPVRNVEFTHDLAEKGVDVIIGHHPHCLQPMERYVTKDGRETFIAYSLGNLTFNKTWIENAKFSGALRIQLKTGLKADSTRAVAVSKIELLPTYIYILDSDENGVEGVRSKILWADKAVLDMKDNKLPVFASKRVRRELMLNTFFLHDKIIGKYPETLLQKDALKYYKEVENAVYK